MTTSRIKNAVARMAFALKVALAASLLASAAYSQVPQINGATQIRGIIPSANLGTGFGGTGTKFLADDGTWKTVAGGVTSWNTRTGAVTPASGDYSVGQITGAEATANKNGAGGYAGLNGSSLLSLAQVATGTPSATTLLWGDQTWRALGAGDIPDISATYLKLAGGTMSGPIVFTNGSKTAPPINSASGMGLYFVTNNIFATNGTTPRWLIDYGHNAEVLDSGWCRAWSSGVVDAAAIDTKECRDAANTIAQINGTNVQIKRYYWSFTDASNFARVSINSGASSSPNIFYECLGTGPCNLNLDLGLASGTTGNTWLVSGGARRVGLCGSASLGSSAPYLCMAIDDSYDIGSANPAVKNVTISRAYNSRIANAAGGTTNSFLVKLTGAPATVVNAATTDTNGIVGICQQNCTTTSSAAIAQTGIATCVFDGATTAGDYVQISATVAGNCHDAGAGLPGAGQIIGRVMTTNAAGGTFSVLLQMKNQ